MFKAWKSIKVPMLSSFKSQVKKTFTYFSSIANSKVLYYFRFKLPIQLQPPSCTRKMQNKTRSRLRIVKLIQHTWHDLRSTQIKKPLPGDLSSSLVTSYYTR